MVVSETPAEPVRLQWPTPPGSAIVPKQPPRIAFVVIVANNRSHSASFEIWITEETVTAVMRPMFTLTKADTAIGDALCILC